MGSRSERKIVARYLDIVVGINWASIKEEREKIEHMGVYKSGRLKIVRYRKREKD